FDVCAQTDKGRFDPADPLGQRWIRYWPWPLGQQKEAPLRDRALASDSTRAVAAAVGRQVAQRDGRERVRLLYVGFTRARDHLVLAVPLDAKGNSRTAWLDELVDEQGTILELPNSPLHPLQVRGTTGEYQAAARVWTLTANSNGAANDSPDDSCVSGKAGE